MFDPSHVNSGSDYAQMLIDNLLETERSLPRDQQMPIDYLTHLTKLIEDKADDYYAQYIVGKRETFMFSDIDMMELFQKASECIVSEAITELLDKDMVKLGVNDQGEIVYSLTEEGEKMSNLLKNKQ